MMERGSDAASVKKCPECGSQELIRDYERGELV